MTLPHPDTIDGTTWTDPPPYRGQRMHPNSLEAYRDLQLSDRQRAVFEIFVNQHPKNLTDRDVLYYMTGSNAGDMNQVRPRITEMVQDRDVPLKEKGTTKCRYTGKLVRVVGLAEIPPDPCTVPAPIIPDIKHTEQRIRELYPNVKPGQQLPLI